MRTLLPLAVLLLLLTSCGTVDGQGGAGPGAAGRTFPSSLEGRTYLSTVVTEDGADRPLVEGSRVRLAFASGRVSAQAGCNTMAGDYRTDDGRLVVEQLSSTLMACSEELMRQDTWLSDLLEGGPSFTLDGDQLVLTSGATAITLLDRTVADPDRPLAGTVWRVDTLISQDAVSSTPRGAEASLTFGDGGTLEVHAGCNRGSGTWTSDGDTVTVSRVVLTQMACEGARAELERAVTDVLGAGRLQLEITADRLTLTGADGKGLGLRAG